jgi:hypothetical protein
MCVSSACNFHYAFSLCNFYFVVFIMHFHYTIFIVHFHFAISSLYNFYWEWDRDGQNWEGGELLESKNELKKICK